jgi:hypothetical protein
MRKDSESLGAEGPCSTLPTLTVTDTSHSKPRYIDDFICFSSTDREAHAVLANPPHHNPVPLSVSGLSHFPHILPTQNHQHHNTQRESSMLISP